MKRDVVLAHAFIAILGLYATAILAREFTNVVSPGGGVDLHAYWYAAHFVRQGVEPYQAYFDGREPAVPVVYLDGHITSTGPVAQPGLTTDPSNTASALFIMYPLGFFSWPVAKIIWMVFNLMLVLLIPWLALPLCPVPLSRRLRAAFAVSFCIMIGTRVTIGNGQTSLLVLAALLLAYVSMLRSQATVSGIAYGIALSKYSLAAPLFILIVHRRQWRTLVMAISVQLAAIAMLSVMTNTAPISIVHSYIRVMQRHAEISGMTIFSLLPSHWLFAVYPVAIATATAIGIGLLVDIRRATRLHCANNELFAFSITALWLLLSIYHNIYDSVIIIVPVLYIIWRLSTEPLRYMPISRAGVVALLVLILAIMSIPGAFMNAIIHNWSQIADQAYTVSCMLLLILTVVVWIVSRGRSNRTYRHNTDRIPLVMALE